MQYVKTYSSPIGKILLAADEEGLCGLWFEGAKYFGQSLEKERKEEDTPVLKKAEKWLDDYFAGRDPGRFEPLHLNGTPFQKEVWQILQTIPYGQTMTYKEISEKLASGQGREHMSAQAVGQAVGHNPVSLIVPCHRVIGTDGSLTGYAGGMDRKVYLLKLEGSYNNQMHVPA